MILHSAFIYLAVCSALLLSLQIFAKPIKNDDCSNRIDQELGAKLSPKASIVHYTSAAPRWSTYHAPQPGTIVNVAEENDVVETVKYCIENNLDFLTQSGGHGFATTFHIDKKDLIINMRGLNKVSINDAKDEITFGGGALVGEIVELISQEQVEATIPTCSCVGMSGATLGGGFNRHIGRFGFAIDNLLSVNLVTADGELTTVTPTSSPDLWWALRGAGANFGVVTSFTMKAYPLINNGLTWFGTFTYSSDQLEDLVQIYNDFNPTKEMYLTIVLSTPSPDFTPSIGLSCLYSGPEEAAQAAFKPFYDLGPVSNASGEIPNEQVYHLLDSYCLEGLRRPAYTAGLKKLDPKAMRKIWNEYVSVVTENPSFNQTFIFIESYSPEKIREVSDSSSAFPHRDFNFLPLLNPAYDDPKLDPVAEKFGKKVRELWNETSGFDDLRAYINYGHGDESLNAIYGENLARLEQIKSEWDKHGRFSQFFPIPRE